MTEYFDLYTADRRKLGRKISSAALIAAAADSRSASTSEKPNIRASSPHSLLTPSVCFSRLPSISPEPSILCLRLSSNSGV